MIYSYGTEEKKDEPNNILPTVLVIGASAALIAAAALFMGYRSRKKRMIE